MSPDSRRAPPRTRSGTGAPNGPSRAPERGTAAHSAVRVAFTSQCSGPSVRTSKVHSPGSCAI